MLSGSIKSISLVFLLLSMQVYLECLEMNFSNTRIKAVVLGDTRPPLLFEKIIGHTSKIYANHIASILKILNADIILHTGDIVKVGSTKKNWFLFEKSFGSFLRKEPPIFFPVIGNHDLDLIPSTALKNYFETFPYLNNQRWYCVLINKKILLLSLDTNFKQLSKEEKEKQKKFLKETLQNHSKNFQLVLINFHHPIYKNLYKLSLRKDYTENFKEAVDNIAKPVVLLNGHFHNFFYHKIDKKKILLITGGAGAPLHTFSPNFLNKNHFITMYINTQKNTLLIKLVIVISPSKFAIKKITTLSF
jgi:glutaredoxin